MFEPCVNFSLSITFQTFQTGVLQKLVKVPILIYDLPISFWMKKVSEILLDLNSYAMVQELIVLVEHTV